MTKYLLFKYLRFDKSQPFISLSAILAFLGVSVGLMVLIVAMSLMNGFQNEFERKLFAMNYPITIISHTRGGVDADEVSELKAKFPQMKFSPYISTQVVMKDGKNLEGGVIFGVNFDDESQINSIIKDGLEGKNLQEFELLVGSGILSNFALNYDDKLTLVFTELDPNGFSLMPKLKRFDIKASFHSGLIAYDKGFLYTNISSLAKILGYKDGFYDGVHIYSQNPHEDIKKLNSELKFGKRAIGWWEQNGNFFAALELEKRALFIVLMLIILVASLNIVSSLLMTIMNRRHEIALLLSLGASKLEIKKVFLSLGLVIGGGGIVFGVVLGLFGVYLLSNFDIISLPADVYGSSKLPMELSLKDFLLIVFGAFVVVFVSSYYPAQKASKVDVLKTLRNE